MNHIDFSVIAQAYPFLLKGLVFSLELTAVGFVGGLVLGIGLALVRHLEVPVASQLASAYITLIRSVPLIMVLFWFFFLMPLVLMWMTGASRPVQIGPVWTAFVTFTLFEAAYYAEIIRAGFKSIAKGQYGACRALGMSTWQTYRLIILPQVLRVVSPILLTQTIILFQDTSLVYVLSVTDLLGAASKIAQRDGRLVEMYLAVAVIYMVLCSITSQLVAVLKNRYAVPGRR
ncbi:L-glutamate ABC transporter membrane protein /L-aspartate ABC transporter membrane protein [Variovorax sp. CF079]|uniref:amino acid ABC transporter permease n=1 Tax=Variovorax sp. CF079 TaxID=1882774 RepID=UPI00087DF5F0|nr:amino acid ABC transporter permease [Variovorax sp. CF079]SDC59507.1 L-glutamate ABC transporter membrane protein /L-aspartate ABC transporter membrane protein [Variovorax sp. CF079]